MSDAAKILLNGLSTRQLREARPNSTRAAVPQTPVANAAIALSAKRNLRWLPFKPFCPTRNIRWEPHLRVASPGRRDEPASRPDAAPDKPAAPCGTVVGSTKLGSVSNTAEASTFAVARGRQLHRSTGGRRLKTALDVSSRVGNSRIPGRSKLATRRTTRLQRRAREPRVPAAIR